MHCDGGSKEVKGQLSRDKPLILAYTSAVQGRGAQFTHTVAHPCFPYFSPSLLLTITTLCRKNNEMSSVFSVTWQFTLQLRQFLRCLDLHGCEGTGAWSIGVEWCGRPNRGLWVPDIHYIREDQGATLPFEMWYPSLQHFILLTGMMWWKVKCALWVDQGRY